MTKTDLFVRIFSLFVPLLAAYNYMSAACVKAEFTRINSNDTVDYRLNVDETKISPLRDTMFGAYPVKCLMTHCPATIDNNTNDTLKYLAMSVSWWDYYKLDNHNFALAADYWNVFKNGEVVIVVPPHRSVTRSIGIITCKDYFRGEKLRIAMDLRRIRFGFPDLKAINWIWSNEVTIH